MLPLERMVRARSQSPRVYNPEDIILASYPKSGNTWLRFILSNITKILAGDPAEVDFHTINYYAPHVGGANNKADGYEGFEGADRFLKTHFYYTKYFDQYRSLLLVRNPRDTLISFYDYQKYEVGRRVKDISSFVRHWRMGVRGWNYFYKTWFDNYTALIVYEELVVDPVGTVSRALDHLGVVIDRDAVKEAVELSSRERMIMLLDERGDPFRKSEKYEFVRKSESERRSSDLSDRDSEFIRAVAGKTAARYGYFI